MKVKSTLGDLRIRGVDFPKGKAVTVYDVDLFNKVLGIEGVEEVKRGRKANDKDDA